MIERIRRNWHLFANGRPGLRFRDRYHLHQSRRRRGGFDLLAMARVVGGVLLVVASALFGWLPVLGWGTATLGLGMLASEFYAVARLMDRLEVGARRLFKPIGKPFMRLPAWAQLFISLTVAVAAFTIVYGLYSLTFG